MNKMAIGMYSLLCTCWMGCCGGMEPSDDFGKRPGSSSEVVPRQEGVLSALRMRITEYSDPT
ncbi:MAG: hypothetical protein LBF76_00290, partial [Holosporales bacterium]|nr:hypothetical protein [Holosporales bacterium]